MKMLIALVGLLALSAVVPAAAAEGAPTPTLELLATTSPACSSTPASSVPTAQGQELPAWLSSDPVFLSEVLEAGCASFCVSCGGCCAILGHGQCACC